VYISPSKMHGTYGIELTGEVLRDAGSLAVSLTKGKAVHDDPTFKQMCIQGRFLTMVEGMQYLTYSKFLYRHGDAAKKFIENMDWLEGCAIGAWEREQERHDTDGSIRDSRGEATKGSKHLEALPSE